jgi:hypothetical protein
MTNLEQFDLPCKTDCPFIIHGLRQCGTGYKQKSVSTILPGIKTVVKAQVPERATCHTNLTAVVDLLDKTRPENALMTDANPTIPYILTIAYFTDAGLLPVGGVNDGTYYPISHSAI